MERTVKTWGEKWNIFKNDLCEVSFLCLHPRQRCSWHRHQTKFNLFFVVSGELTIKLENDIAVMDKYQFFTTRPREWHEFRTHDKPTKIIEVMFVEYDAEDIEREKLGGPLEEINIKLHSICPKCGDGLYVDEESKINETNCENCK